MLNKGLDKIIEKHDKKWAEEQKRRDKESKEYLARWREDLREARSAKRWTVGTIITCTIALAGYLSALIHVTH